MLVLYGGNNKDALVMQYMTRMKEFAELNTPTLPIITYSTEQFYHEQNEEINDQILNKIGNYTLQEKKKLLKNLDALETFTQIIDVRSDFAPQIKEEPKEVKRTTITFKELYELFIKEKKLTAPNTTQSTWRDYEAAYQDFIYVIENAEARDITSFTKEDLRTFADALHNHLPSSRTKKPQFKHLTYSELKTIELKENEKTAFATKQKKMLSIKQIFDIASDARYSYITENIVEPFLMKKPKNSKKIQKERKPLSEENLKKLFTSKLYTDKLKHTLTFAPEKYWIPIIAGYSGMRQNEICQLYVEDLKSITTDMGEIIWYFDLNEEKDKHLKNENAFRLVPLHPKLIELGFIEYYNSIKNKQPRLWKNLSSTRKRKGTTRTMARIL
ncbi:hypothetical protein [Sulfurimonas sp. HSL-1716]|uniref:hypothetical protein n=1 Tax=Hydrocurvibacter sulfurireducens TaxID=3131937 RepID=UPI0031F8E4AE